MLDPAEFDFCSEFYTIVKTIEVMVPLWDGNRLVRIDALLSRDHDPAYTTVVYTREHVTLTRSMPTTRPAPFETAVWALFPDFPWTASSSADEVLKQALSFLYDLSDI